jgi:type II secretory pathway component PulK
MVMVMMVMMVVMVMVMMVMVMVQRTHRLVDLSGQLRHRRTAQEFGVVLRCPV